MRRFVSAVVLGTVLAMLVAPLAIDRNMHVELRVADSASCCPKQASNSINQVTQADDCVTIALPIIGTSKCIKNDKASGGAIINYLADILKVLDGAVGLFVILMLVVGGIQYITSVGDPGRIKTAKKTIQNALIALFLFLTMFAFLTFILPGGVLK